MGTDWEQLRQQAALSRVETFKARNGQRYMVCTDRLGADLENVHWIGDDDAQVQQGVLLGDYYVWKPDDDSWQATVRIAKPANPGDVLRVVSVEIRSDDIDKTALPIPALKVACAKVGAVIQFRSVVKGEQSGLNIVVTNGRMAKNATVEAIHPDDLKALTGHRPQGERGYRNKPETRQRVWNAMQDYEKLKQTDSLPTSKRNPPKRMTKREYVSITAGVGFENVQKDMTAATRHFNNNPGGTK